jgi:MYXO-CTERM domain-containing protein
MKRLLVKGGELLLGGCILTSSASWVNAAATLTLYDGVNPLITVVDNGPGDLSAATGVILVQTNVGVWSFTIGTATTKPVLGSATDPAMDLTLQANSTAAGSLRLVFSDNGFGPATGLLTATSTGRVVAGAGVTDTYSVYGDPANVVGATTVLIASTGTVPLPTSGSGSGLLGLGAPFSLTQVEQLVASGPTFLNTDVSFGVGPVPEPGVMGLGALGLAVLALGRPRRRQA